MSVEEYQDAPPRLTKEEEEGLITRLYTNSIEQKQRKLEELERRFYPVAEPHRIPEEQIQKSVERQVDQEMDLRRSRREEAEAAAASTKNHPVTNRRASQAARRDGAPVTMTAEEVEESVRRMYDDAVNRKKSNLEESKRRYAPPPAAAKKVPKSELEEWVQGASQPKKTEFTTAEVNKIYGLTS